MSLKLVIDTSIISAAGEKDISPASDCRDFLNKVKNKRFYVVISPEIWTEWKEHKHLSKFSHQWLKSIFARKRFCEIKDSPIDDILRKKIEKKAETPKSLKIMLKDIILIEAAKVKDKRIFSLDEEARIEFNSIANQIPILKTILWANPTIAEEKVLDWLDADAPEEDKRKLGYAINNFS